ncbi:MAG: addiction module antidote protein, HigA family [Omnitrophica bacterium GWA2_50_21]|nr:MAG: addiction module antidote protein, HigA family [Omnitrophica bacterium GWA2_50_21]
MKKNKKLEPIHPGEILDQEFLAPLEISQYRLAKEIHVPARRINEIVQEKRAISADTALRLSKFFGTSAKFWLNLQAQYDLDIQEEKIISELESAIKPFHKAA